MESAIALPSMAHLVSRLILVASSALFMASPVKKRVWGVVDSGQLSATPRSFGSCHFSIVRRESEIICKLKQGAGIRYGLTPRRGYVKIAQAQGR